MNKIYRVIWSKTKNCYVVVSEYAKHNGKCSSTLNKKLIAAFLVAGTVLSVTGSAWAADVYYKVAVDTMESAPETASVWGISTTAVNAGNTAFGTNTVAGEGTVSPARYLNEFKEMKGFTSRYLNSATVYSGSYATAFGDRTIALGDASTSWGEVSIALGSQATSFGVGTFAEGNYSTAFGSHTHAGIFVNDQGGYYSLNDTAFGSHTEAYGGQSTAFGTSTKATGKDSTAFGSKSTASGSSSTAFGVGASASGQAATAFGQSTTAKGTGATAFGIYTEASGNNATAFGWGTSKEKNIASGTASTAFGNKTIASGTISTAFGQYTEASGGGATAFGIGTADARVTAKGTGSTAFGRKTLAAGDSATAFGIETKAEGKGATSFGNITSAAGEYATAFGVETEAEGNGATAFGSKSVASGDYSIAFGEESKAYGENSLAALGGTAGTTANEDGKGSVAIGEDAEALVDYAYAIGQNAKASNDNTIAIGNNTEATGAGAIVFGNESKVSGENSIAIGKGHTISGNNSGAFGDPDTVDADGSYVVGNDSSVESGANESFVMGNSSKASAKRSMIFGNESKVSAEGGIVAGSKSEVSAKDSVAIGNNAKATMENSVALGSGSETTHMGGLDGKKEIEIPGTHTKYTNVKGESPVGTVSVGKPGEERTITNVAAGRIGPDSTDAVNGSELYAVEQKVEANTQDIVNLNNRIDKVGAGAAALAGLHPLDFDPDEKWDFAASLGSYKSEQAVAIGAFYRPNEDTMFSIAGTVGDGRNMINVGVSWKFGQKNRISANRISSAKEIIELRKNQENVHSFLADAVAGNQLDLSKIQLFPDVEENHWAYDYVATMAGNGVLEGYPDGYFKGNRNMTRYEMAAVLYRLMQNGARLSDKALTEFAPELDRIRVDTITQHKDGTPHIQRVRTIKERVEEKADPSPKEDTKKKKAKIKVAEKPAE